MLNRSLVFSGGSGVKDSTNAGGRRPGFDPTIQEDPLGGGNGQLILVFLPGESHGREENQVGYSAQGLKSWT